MDTRIKKEFVRQVLEDYGKDVTDTQLRAMNKYLQFKSGNIVRANSYKVQSSDNSDGSVVFTHAIYQRFLDMKVITTKLGKRKRKRPYPIHNRIIWGKLNRVYDRLMFGLTENTIAEIKNNLENS